METTPRSQNHLGSREHNQIATYKKINESFKKKLVFRFGDDSGFFSEFNNLILAVLYCLDKKIQFVLYSPSDGHLAIKDGWNDYFQPFCAQTKCIFHKLHNERFLMKKVPIKTRLERVILKKHNHIDYFTYELWNYFRSEQFIKKQFNIPQLSINGNLLSATKIVIEMLWKYSDNINMLVQRKILEFELPNHYVGLHIRGGDKTREATIYSPDQYMMLLQKHTQLRDIFVLTDDYCNVSYLRAKYKTYRFFSMCKKCEHGYDFAEFLKLGKNIQLREYVKLLASMDILRKSEIIFGSYKVNPGMFLGMSVGERFIGIDSDRWLVQW